jgi:hypothetical protein
MIKHVDLFSKKPGLSDLDFKAYYENRHAPLALSLLPGFADYRRNYIIPGGTVAQGHIADVPPPPAFDVITEAWFENQDALDATLNAFKNPAVANAITRDEENFFDRGRMTLFAMEEYVTPQEKLGATLALTDRPVKMVCMIKRRPGMSREAFVEYYETRHAVLAAKHLRMIAGYRRSYMIPGSAVQPGHIAKVQPPPDFDVMTEFWYRSQAEFDSLKGALADPEIGRMFAEDEANLFDRTSIQMFMVDECATPTVAIAAWKGATVH